MSACPRPGHPTQWCGSPLRFAVIVTTALLAGCFDDTQGVASSSFSGPFGVAPDPAQGARFLGAVGGDYKSSVVSLIDLASVADGDVHSPPARHSAVLHSGSQVGATAVALSGDVVWANANLPDRHLLAVDRGNAALVELDPRTGKVVRQLSVSTSFYSNPQDVAVRDEHTWLVSRMNRNPVAGATPFDAGDDVVALDPSNGTLLARADLSAAATATDPGTLVAPQRMALTDRLYVPLAMFKPNFKGQASARLAVLRPSDLHLEQVVDLAPIRNCVNIQVIAPGRLLLACQGSFQMAAEQLAQSALVVVDSSGAIPQPLTIIGAPPQGGPWSRDVAVLDPQWAAAVSLGSLQPNRPDRLWLVNLVTGERRAVQDSAQPFGYSGLWADPKRRCVWLGETQRKDGDLLRFLVTATGQVAVGVPVAANPGGLGTLELMAQ